MKNKTISNRFKAGCFIAILLSVISGLMVSGITKTASADELHWATNEREPAKQWVPKPDILKKAYQISRMATDTIANIHKAIDMSREYIKANPNNMEGRVDAYVILAESYANLGDYEKSDKVKLKAYEQGRAEAQKLIKLAPDRWDGWFWWSANAGRMGQLKGIISSLFLLGSLEDHLFKAQKLAPRSTLVLTGLGLMYRQLPWIAGGSKKKSEEYMKKALAIDPHFSFARLELAITFLEEGKKAEAEEELNRLLNEKDPVWKAHYLLWERPKAEALLKNMDNYKKLLNKWHMLL